MRNLFQGYKIIVRYVSIQEKKPDFAATNTKTSPDVINGNFKYIQRFNWKQKTVK